MKFWAIGYKYQEEVYFDFEKGDDTLGLEPTCLLPTQKVAEEMIKEEFGMDYLPVEIELLSLNHNGVWTHTRGRVSYWDKESE